MLTDLLSAESAAYFQPGVRERRRCDRHPGSSLPHGVRAEGAQANDIQPVLLVWAQAPSPSVTTIYWAGESLPAHLQRAISVT